MTPQEPFAVHFYRPSCWLRAYGPDAAAFLQGQFTNDLRPAALGQVVYGLWLNQKGRIVADSFVLKAGEAEYRIASYFSATEEIRRRLEDYLVADEVTLEDAAPAWEAVSVIGEGAGAWLEATPGRPGWIFPGRRAAGENWEWVYPPDAAGAVRARLAGCRQADAAELERLRLEAAIPAVPRDAGSGDLPAETGLDREAISETKGCYLGQEVTARLKSRGSVRRRLFSVRGAGSVPSAPAAAMRGAQPAGELRSAAADREGKGFIGLAMLNLRGFDRNEVLVAAGRELNIV